MVTGTKVVQLRRFRSVRTHNWGISKYEQWMAPPISPVNLYVVVTLLLNSSLNLLSTCFYTEGEYLAGKITTVLTELRLASIMSTVMSIGYEEALAPNQSTWSSVESALYRFHSDLLVNM